MKEKIRATDAAGRLRSTAQAQRVSEPTMLTEGLLGPITAPVADHNEFHILLLAIDFKTATNSKARNN